MSEFLSDIEIQFLRENVDNYKTNDELGLIFNLTRKQITNVLYRNKIRRSYTNNGKVKFDFDFFSEYNEKSCYWAGFIAADGSIGIRPNYTDKFLTISLKESDKNHLENFINDLKSENLSIINRRSKSNKNSLIEHKYCSVILYNNKIVSDLDNLFCIKSQKTLNTIFPEKIPSKYHYDYIRGYIDGDGCISVYNDKGVSALSLSFVGNKDFIEKLATIISIPYYLSKRKGSLFSIKYSKFNSIRVIKKIYLPKSTFCLERKRDRYFEYMDNITNIQKSRLKNYLNKFNE